MDEETDIISTYNLAYIVNIENSMNMDIDFHLPLSKMSELGFGKAFFLEYVYADDIDGEYRKGRAYRSHLKGVALKKIDNPDPSVLNQCKMIIKNKIYRSGGFVLYEIDSIDVYNRLIVTIYDPVTGECINDILLRPEYSSVYQPYHLN